MSNSNDKILTLPVPGRRLLGAAPAVPAPAPAAPAENTVASEAPARRRLADVMNELDAAGAAGKGADPKTFGHALSSYQAAKTADKAPASQHFEPEIHVVDLHDTQRYPVGNKGYIQPRREQAAQTKVYHTVLTEAERQGCRERGQVAFDQRTTLDPKSYYVRREVVRLLNKMTKEEDPRLAMFSYEIAAANFR